MSQRWSLSSVIAVLALTASAHASSEPFVVRVAYAAPPGCPTETSFLQQVLLRARHTRLAAPTESAREFRAFIAQGTGQYQARLEFVDPDGRRVNRELEGSSCNEVAAALELITALAIDPLLTDPDGTSVDATSSIESAPTATGTSSMPTPLTAAEPSPARSVVPGTTATNTGSWTPALGVTFGAATDVAPHWVPNVAFYTELDSPSRRSAFRLELSYAAGDTNPSGAAGSAFRLIAGAIEGCPWSPSIGSRLRLWPCAALEAGEFRAKGRNSAHLPYPNDVDTLWLAGDLVLRTELALSRHVALELGAKMRIPLIRNSYVYERPRAPAYETPAIGGVVYLGVGVRFGR